MPPSAAPSFGFGLPVATPAAAAKPAPPSFAPPKEETAHIAGFQLPVPSTVSDSTGGRVVLAKDSPPPPVLQAPPVKTKVAAAAGMSTSAAVPPAHPRPPMRTPAHTGGALATSSATTKAVSPAAAPLAPTRAPSEAVFMDTAEAPSRTLTTIIRRPPSPTPAQLQEMFLQSLRAYRRSLLASALRGWRVRFEEVYQTRQVKEAFLRELAQRADTFASAKWLRRWRERVLQQREAQERFRLAQARLHAPPMLLHSAKAGTTASPASSRPLLLLKSPGASHEPEYLSSSLSLLPVGGVSSGLSTPLVKLHRMGVEVPFEEQQPEEEEEWAYDVAELGPSGPLNFDEADEEEQQEDAEGDEEAGYVEGDDDGEGVYDDEEGGDEAGEDAAAAEGEEYAEGEGEEEGGYADEGAEEDAGAAEEYGVADADADLAPMDQEEDEEEDNTPSRSLLRGSNATQSPPIKAQPIALHTSFVSPPASAPRHFASPAASAGASLPRRGGPGSSHKRSRQSVEIDEFLRDYVSPRRAVRMQHQQKQHFTSPNVGGAGQQPAASFSLEGAPLLEDESDAEEANGDAQTMGILASGGGRSSRAKLFHTPSHVAERAVFASPLPVSSAAPGGLSAFDVGAAIHAAAAAPSPPVTSYLRPRLSVGFGSPASNGATGLGALLRANALSSPSPASLAQKVASELRASSKLDELMQQLEYRYGAAP